MRRRGERFRTVESIVSEVSAGTVQLTQGFRAIVPRGVFTEYSKAKQEHKKRREAEAPRPFGFAHKGASALASVRRPFGRAGWARAKTLGL